MARALRAIVVLALIAGAGLYYRDHVSRFALQAYREVVPCAVPITYSIAHIDPRFGISTSTLQEALDRASGIWSDAAGKPLFAAADEGSILVRMEYDERQATTETLQNIGTDIDDTYDIYASAKEEHAQSIAAYDARIDAFEARYASYQRDVNEYRREVRMWNSRGGAPRAEYEALQSRERSLEAEATSLKSEQVSLQKAAAEINELVSTINTLAKELNMNVDMYNTVGDTVADEFEEAVYESIPGVETITVYEYASLQKLERVLAHEFGHALGIGHVDDENAIMFRINKGTNLALTESDTEALAARCKSR